MQAGDYVKAADSPGLARVSEVAFEQHPPAGVNVAALLRGPHLTSLRRLAGWFWSPGPVLASDPPPGLRELWFQGFAVDTMPIMEANRVTPAELAAAPLLRGLTELSLVAPDWPPADYLSAVARAAPNLVRLRVDLDADVSAGLARLDLPRLKRLAVTTRSEAAAAAAIAGNARLAGLEALSLGRLVDVASFRRLVESPHLASLRRLDARANAIADNRPLVDYLLASDAVLRLEKLSVGGGWMQPADAARVFDRLGPRLMSDTDAELEPTLRRLGRW